MSLNIHDFLSQWADDLELLARRVAARHGGAMTPTAIEAELMQFAQRIRMHLKPSEQPSGLGGQQG